MTSNGKQRAGIGMIAARGAALGLVLSGLAGTALARQDGGKAPAEKKPDSTVLLLEKLDVERVLVSPKDAALKAALKMLPARLREVPGEVPPGGPAELTPELVSSFVSLIGSPTRLGVTYNPQKQEGGLAGFGVVLSSEMNADSARDVQREVTKLLRRGGAPEPKASELVPGMMGFVLGGNVVRFGPREVGGVSSYQLHAGSVEDADATLRNFSAIPVPAGVTPFMRGQFSVAPLTPLLSFLQPLVSADPAMARTFKQYLDAGVIGPNAGKMSYIFGHSNTHAVSEFRWQNYAKAGEQIGTNLKPITPEMMRAVPADAHMAIISQTNMQSILEQFDQAIKMVEDQGADPLAEVKRVIGVDIRNDLLAAFNGASIAYLSDATGGGTLGSGVVLAGLVDAAKFTNTHAALVQRANGALLDAGTRGYVSIRSYDADGGTFFTASFNGLPVPIEPTWTIAGTWLVIGATPQATMAARAQIMGKGDAGLGSNRLVLEGMPSGVQPLTLSFVDAAKVGRDGYPLVTMAGSMVGNAVRSRAGASGGGLSREPGVIVPGYAALMDGAKPIVGVSYYDGADYVIRGQYDKSVLVNMTTVAGAGVRFAPVFAAVGIGAAAAAAEGRAGGMNPPMFPMPGDGPGDEPAPPRRKPAF